eukprot:1391819-Amorphochlora_amoeboformis.AAC.1
MAFSATSSSETPRKADFFAGISSIMSQRSSPSASDGLGLLGLLEEARLGLGLRISGLVFGSDGLVLDAGLLVGVCWEFVGMG